MARKRDEPGGEGTDAARPYPATGNALAAAYAERLIRQAVAEARRLQKGERPKPKGKDGRPS